VPDTDTDGDGVADCVDNCAAVANPSQTDCDGNGIGEACETFIDCNANGIPDLCDLASGFAQDCNGNGKPDSCDIADSGSPYPGAVQWTVASGGNGHWYSIEIRSAGVSWSEANTASSQFGGYLATVTSSSENEFVFQLANKADAWVGQQEGGPWLGGFLDQSSSSPTWKWITGEPWSWTNWVSGNPNGPGVWNENRLTYSEHTSGWNDFNESGVQPCCKVVAFIIEWPAGPTTESDCNANTIPDSCDLANGGDCNNNGLLDACETFDQTTPDCNNNSVPDSCDIESRFARDCDLNNVPDSCDIAAGALDENSDGRIDACNYAMGDFDLSNEVDSSDLSFMLLFFGEENPPFGDLDGSGVCDSADLSFCLLNFGPLE
jgi:hypothetical protein